MEQSATIFVLGINHTTTSVEMRELVDHEKLFQTIYKNLFPKLISEFMILSTCNRTEIYVISQDWQSVKKNLQNIFRDPNSYIYESSDAIKHFFSVAAGLDSMMLGETEILAQIRQAYIKAMQNKTIGPILHQLNKDALRIGKHTRNTTRIGEGVTSSSQAAILLAKKRLGDLTNKNVLIIGAGDIAQRVLNALSKQETTTITVSNRTYHHAKKLTDTYGGMPTSFKELPKCIANSDVVISATSSSEIIIPAEMITYAMEKRSSKPLYLIDLAVPRDIEESVSKIENVYLYNIDALQELVNKNFKIRKKAVYEVKNIIDGEVSRYMLWYRTRRAVPILTALTKKSEDIKNKELANALQKLSHLNKHDKKIIAILAKRLESKILARPIANLKQITNDTKGQEYLEVVKMLFEL